MQHRFGLDFCKCLNIIVRCAPLLFKHAQQRISIFMRDCCCREPTQASSWEKHGHAKMLYHHFLSYHSMVCCGKIVSMIFLFIKAVSKSLKWKKISPCKIATGIHDSQNISMSLVRLVPSTVVHASHTTLTYLHALPIFFWPASSASYSHQTFGKNSVWAFILQEKSKMHKSTSRLVPLLHVSIKLIYEP